MRGSIVKRGNGYAVVVELDRDPSTGRRRQKWHSGFRTRKEAERARVQLLGELDRGMYVEPTRETLGAFLTGWLEGKRGSLRPTTFAAYRDMVSCYVAPRLGGVPLAKVDGLALERLYAELLTGGRRDGGALAPKTVRNVHGMLTKAFRDAVRTGRLARNPAASAEPPSPKSPEMRAWTAEQLRAFLEHVGSDRHYAVWLLVATTGMRRGELLGVRWTDVDLDAARLDVRQARTLADHDQVIGEPKSQRSRRSLALDPATVAALRSWKAQQAAERLVMGAGWPDSGLVVTEPTGEPVHPQRLTRRFNAHVAASGLPPLRLHDVRHSYATAALRAGVPVKVVSQRLGHANVVVTLSVYAHVMPGDDEAAAARVASLILGSG